MTDPLNPSQPNTRDSHAPRSCSDISVSMLRVNARLKQDVFDPKGVLLLAAGSVITKQFLKHLKDRKITAVQCQDLAAGSTPSNPNPSTVSKPSPQHHIREKRFQSLTAQQLDDVIEAGGFADEPTPEFNHRVTPRLELHALREKIRAGLKLQNTALQYYQGQIKKVVADEYPDLEHAVSIVNTLFEIIERDASLGPLIIHHPAERRLAHEPFIKQSINAMILTTSFARYLGFRPDQATNAGLAGLVQDLGMYLLSDSIRNGQRMLTTDEILQVKYHPIYTLDLIDKNPSIAQTTRTIIYQAHERCDGSGYPIGREAVYIHPLAKLLAIVDTYTSIITQKTFRQARSPYTAIKTILVEANQSRLDLALVRAFIDYVSLFPVGSYVTLSDKRIGKVLRSNRTHHTRPVVLLLNEDGGESDTELDLSQTDLCEIARAD